MGDCCDEIYVGDDVIVQAAVTDNRTNRLVNPGTAKFVFKAPTGAKTEFVFGVSDAVTNPSVGIFEITYRPMLPKNWTYALITTNPAKTEPGSFTVQEPPI